MEYSTVTHFARIKNVSCQTIYTAIENKKLNVLKILGGSPVICLDKKSLLWNSTQGSGGGRKTRLKRYLRVNKEIKVNGLKLEVA